MYLYLLCLLLFLGCNSPYRGADLLGAEDFVLDSYRIREGKRAVLEIEGRPLPPLEVPGLQEGERLLISIGEPSKGEVVYHEVEVEREPTALTACGCTLQLLGQSIGAVQEELCSALAAQYKEGETPQVAVTRIASSKGPIQIIGSSSCSSLETDGTLKLFALLAQVGLSRDTNLFASYVVRGGQLLGVDLHRLVVEGDMSQNILMEPGDQLYLAAPEETPVMVMGEVHHPRAIPMRGPSLPLREALARAGGLSFTGDRRYIQVIRGGALKPRVYSLNWQHIMQLPNESLLLIPGDVVVVAATPIAEWGRFVNQLLPGPFLFNLGGQAGPYVGF